MPQPSPSDQTLFKLLSQGDEDAFRTLFDRYYALLVAIAMNLVKDLNTAKDVVQEVFLYIWRKRTELTPPTNLEAYLKRAAINRSINYIKSRRPTQDITQSYGLASQAPNANQVMEASDLQKVIQQTIAAMPERCRMVFVLKRIEGKSQKEIAADLEISTKTVENQMTKALKLLREALKPYVDRKMK